MASAAQIAANRANSLKSTGPKSPPGKAASSRNAVKHGLSGSTTAALMAAEGDRAMLEERKAMWIVDFDPQGEEESWLFERVVAESIRAERCMDAYFALCRDHGRRAQLQWDADRRRDADEKAARLAMSPHTVARQIEGTAQGCDLMLSLWRGLSSSLERHRTWTDPQRSLALDLLGVRPDLRDAETPVDPAEGDVFEARRAVVASEIARLESLRDGVLATRDADERVMAESTLGAELTRPLQLMHRYESAALRRQAAAWRKLDEAREARGSDPTPTPRPQPQPAPVPVAAAEPAPAPVAAEPRPTITPAAVRPMTPVAVEPSTPRREPAAPSRPLNRHQRRAQAAQARRAGR